jgi:hypothetical protein
MKVKFLSSSHLAMRHKLNGTARFKKHKQLFEYKHLLLETSGDQSYDPYLIVVDFLNTRAD